METDSVGRGVENINRYYSEDHGDCRTGIVGGNS